MIIKYWREDENGKLICDGDCHSWNLGICTCGLVHHLEGSQRHYLDSHNRKFRSRHWKCLELLREAEVEETMHCKHNVDLDNDCKSCEQEVEQFLLDAGFKKEENGDFSIEALNPYEDPN